jgi:hypothetical protein
MGRGTPIVEPYRFAGELWYRDIATKLAPKSFGGGVKPFSLTAERRDIFNASRTVWSLVNAILSSFGTHKK